MGCYICSVTNTGSTLQYFDYQRCSDYLTWYQVELFPGQVRRLWETTGSFRTPYDNPTIIYNCKPFLPQPTPFPPAIPTATPVPTATAIPTATPVPTATSTPVPTATSTPIPTATPAPTATSTPIPTATSTPVPTATSTPIPTATSTPIPTATPTQSPTPTETPTPTPTLPPLNACDPLYMNINGTALNYFDPTTYTTSVYYDFGHAISAMTRVSDNLLLYDGADILHTWDMTGFVPFETSQINMSAFTQSGNDIYGLGPFTSSTEILVSDQTNNIWVADISTSVATNSGLLFANGLPNSRGNIIRDNNLGITYVLGGTSQIKAYYDNGTQYSTATITGTTRGLYKDQNTGEIYAINDIGDVYYIPQLSGTVTPYYVTGITPDNTVLVGVAQSNVCEPSPFGFKLTSNSPSGVTATTLTFTADTFTWIDWGDGSPYSTVTGTGVFKAHTYASPYVGDINIYTYDNFANLRGFSHAGSPTYVGGGTGAFSGGEFQKITGLNYYYSNPYATPFVLNASYTQIPSQMEVILTFSVEANLTGYTSQLPTTLQRATLNGHGYGDVAYLPSSLVDFRLSYSSLDGNVSNINAPNMEVFWLYGDDTISGDTSGFPSSLNYISLLDHNTISGDTSGLPKATQTAYLTSVGLKPAITIYGYNTISGDTSSFDVPLDRLDIGGYNTVSGDTSGFPNTITRIQIEGNNTISGPLSGLTFTGSNVYIYIGGNNTIYGDGIGKPSGATNLIIGNNLAIPATGTTLSGNISTYSGASLTIFSIGGANTISGDTSDIPRNMTTFYLTGYNTISGDCANLPSGVTYTIAGNNTISGDISGLPNTFNTISINGNNTISGNIGGIPNGIVSLTIGGNNTITGPLSGLSSTTLTYLSIQGGGVTVTGPIAGISLPTGLKSFILVPQAGGAGLTQSEVDDLLVYFTTITWATGGYKSVDLRGLNAAPSAVGLAAKTTLLAPPYSLSAVLTN